MYPLFLVINTKRKNIGLIILVMKQSDHAGTKSAFTNDEYMALEAFLKRGKLTNNLPF
jgi:hypothetical protein